MYKKYRITVFKCLYTECSESPTRWIFPVNAGKFKEKKGTRVAERDGIQHNGVIWDVLNN